MKKGASTPRQMAYARRSFAGSGIDRKHIALDVGYAPSVARLPKEKIEQTKGFNNAMAQLASESNLLALQIIHEFKSRGVQDFSNKDLVGALNAIGAAWGRFNAAVQKDKSSDQTGNKLRSIILQRVENQTIEVEAKSVEKVEEPKVDLDW